MYYVLPMGILQGERHLAGDLHRRLDRQLDLSPEPVAQRLAPDIGHGVPGPAGYRAGVEDREDVRMLQPGGEADLAEEPLGAQAGGDLRVEHLEGHRPIVLEVLRQVDRGHPTAAKLALDAVAIGQGRCQKEDHGVSQQDVLRGRLVYNVRVAVQLGLGRRSGSPAQRTAI
jgi:hypothetical protein